MVSALQFWQQINKSGGGAFLIRRKHQHCTIFSRIFCINFLIDAIKPNVEKNSQLVLFFTKLFNIRKEVESVRERYEKKY